MATFRVNKNSNYTVMSNTHLRELEMSLKAKGLLSMMLSLPEDWDYSVDGLCAICKENQSSIKSTLDELKAFGYLVVIKRMPNETKSGRFEYVYNIYETPQKQPHEKQWVEKQGIENQPLEFQPIENQPQLNIYIPNTKELNTDDKRERDNEPPPRIDQVVALYNTTCHSLSPVEFMTDKREQAIEDILKVCSTDRIKKCFEMAESSSFLKGQNERGWRATFDWLCNPSNMAKVLEGNFSDCPAKNVDKHQVESFETDDFWQAAVNRTFGDDTSL
jgi:hypothetical protein